jgi:Haemolymph juvenile hormone binding protein (JHBP)
VSESFQEAEDLPDLKPFVQNFPGVGVATLKFQKGTEILGIPGTQVQSCSGFQSDPQGNKLKIHYKIPKITIKGPYTSELPYIGNRHGDGKMVLTNLDLTLTADTIKNLKQRKTYMKVQHVTFAFSVEEYSNQISFKYLLIMFFHSVKFEFTNNVPAEKVYMDLINVWINANWRFVIEYMRNSVNESFAEFYKDAANSFFEEEPYDRLIY